MRSTVTMGRRRNLDTIHDHTGAGRYRITPAFFTGPDNSLGWRRRVSSLGLTLALAPILGIITFLHDSLFLGTPGTNGVSNSAGDAAVQLAMLRDSGDA